MQLEQALISKADFNALAVRNCEGTEQLRRSNLIGNLGGVIC